MRISPNFTKEEFTKNSKGLKNEPDQQSLVNLCLLCYMLLEPVRKAICKPISITSGYRGKEVNKAVGGTDKSQHLTGNACDINVDGMTKLELFKFIGLNYEFDQLIYEMDSNCLHVSYVLYNNRKQMMIRKKVDGKKHYQEVDRDYLIKAKSI